MTKKAKINIETIFYSTILSLTLFTSCETKDEPVVWVNERPEDIKFDSNGHIIEQEPYNNTFESHNNEQQ